MVTGLVNHKNNVPVYQRLFICRGWVPRREICAPLQRLSRLLDGEMADLFHRARYKTNLTNNLKCQGPGSAAQAYATFAAGESRREGEGR
jgi:hypothetical protein